MTLVSLTITPNIDSSNPTTSEPPLLSVSFPPSSSNNNSSTNTTLELKYHNCVVHLGGSGSGCDESFLLNVWDGVLLPIIESEVPSIDASSLSSTGGIAPHNHHQSSAEPRDQICNIILLPPQGLLHHHGGKSESIGRIVACLFEAIDWQSGELLGDSAGTIYNNPSDSSSAAAASALASDVGHAAKMKDWI
jgi:hypothetical protein